MALFRTNGDAGSALGSVKMLMDSYETNQADLYLPKSFLQNFKYVRMLTTDTDFGGVTVSNISPLNIVPDATGTPVQLTASAPVDISALTYTNFLSFNFRDSTAAFHKTLIEFYN